MHAIHADHTNKSLKNLEDSALYSLAKHYGLNARIWLRKFAGLLPEIYRRQLYKRRGYASIYEFAAKLAGMSQETVDRILKLEERLQDKPKLLRIFENGEQGWSKLRKVAYIATPKTDGQWAARVKQMNMHALEVYVRTSRSTIGLETNPQNNTPSVQAWNTVLIRLSPENEKKFRRFKKNLERGKGAIGWNEVMTEIFSRLGNYEKNKCKKVPAKKLGGEIKRYIPAEVRHAVEARAEEHCEFPGCNNPIDIFHHTKRFALEKNHDAATIVGLCKSHERLVHSGFVKNENDVPWQWKLAEEPDTQNAKWTVDQRVTARRLEPASGRSPFLEAVPR